jgi:hypothetical protein
MPRKTILYILMISMMLAARSARAEWSFVGGDFELFGHVVAGAGYQHFSNNPVTEWTNDGTFPGVIGAYIPNVAAGIPPSPGQDNFMFYVDDVEIDVVKSFGKNVAIRADLEFGRIASGSFWNFNLQQAYVTANIPVGNGIELMIGRFWGPAGFEAYDAYDNEVISWSILTRSNAYPYVITGAKLRYEFNDLVELHVYATNNMTNDTTAMIDDVPSFAATLKFTWGKEESESYASLTPFFGPESGDNRHFSYGADISWQVYVTDSFAIGGEGVFRRDNGFGGPNTDYAGGLFELYYDFTDAWYGVARYAYMQQFDPGNGVLNLTGAKQQIHEASLAGGWWLNDACVIKAEARFDYIDPAGAADQWNLGGALAFAYGF